MKKKLIGRIVSNKTQNTVVVNVDRLVAHPKYLKRFKVSKRYKAHISGGGFKVGDSVVIEACRPISKDKKWKVLDLVRADKPIKAEEVSQ